MCSARHGSFSHLARKICYNQHVLQYHPYLSWLILIQCSPAKKHVMISYEEVVTQLSEVCYTVDGWMDVAGPSEGSWLQLFVCDCWDLMPRWFQSERVQKADDKIREERQRGRWGAEGREKPRGRQRGGWNGWQIGEREAKAPERNETDDVMMMRMIRSNKSRRLL